ncbi:MAG: hypothetical protein AB7N24_19660 [Dehalococcoidia bacterium]
MPRRKIANASEARRKVDRLRALRSSPRALHDFAMEILADEGSPELVKLALESLGEEIRPDDGPVLRQLYNDFDIDGVKKDPGGNVRVEVLKALWHLRSGEDVPFALRARNTSERTLQANGEMIRAAGLALLGVLDPARACLEAVLVLGRDDSHPLTESSHMTGEPALTAVRLLASQQETNALLLYLLTGHAPTTEVIGETLRGLASLEFATLEPILVDLANRDDDGLLVAVCDVLVELPPSPGLAPIVRKLLDSPSRGEVYEFLVSSIVASRRMDLVELVLESLPTEMSQKRLRSALDALQLAPKTPAVETAINQLETRLARQTPPPG